MKRTITIHGLLMLSCGIMCLAQSRYNNQIQPGLSTRSDVDAALGQPLRSLNANLFEYTPPQGASRLVIQYRAGSNIVEVIEADFSRTYSRESMLQSLKLPDQPDVRTIQQGKLIEYFGGDKFLALAYAGAEVGSGVNLLGYYSPELFERVTASLRSVSAPASTPPPGYKPTLSGSGSAQPANAGTQPALLAAETDFRVKLLTPLNTQTSKKGDKITAQVLDPAPFTGDILEGTIRESKSGAKLKGKSVLNFTFDTLNRAGQAQPVQANVKSMTNSKGQQDVDEEGQIVKKKNNIGKLAAGTAIGALIGGLAGGGRGAAIGAGIGAAASLVLIEVAVEGANVSFAPGSELILSVKPQNRPGGQQVQVAQNRVGPITTTSGNTNASGAAPTLHERPRSQAIVPAGTTVTVRSVDGINARQNEAQDFMAEVQDAVIVDSRQVIAPGTPVAIRVTTAAQQPPRFHISFFLNGRRSDPVSAALASAGHGRLVLPPGSLIHFPAETTLSFMLEQSLPIQ